MTLGGIVVFFLADLWMCTHHRAECGGMALAFPKTEQILKILMVLPGALAIGIVAYGRPDQISIPGCSVDSFSAFWCLVC